MKQWATLVALSTLATPAVAGDFILQFPLECALGDSCFIQQYVDHDRGPAALDFTCGPLCYDGHKGTDFGLPSFQAMRKGVTVIAAASGVVRGLRDGVPDVGIRAQTDGQECGNGIVLDHGDGWITQYCHLKRGSIKVTQGQHVSAGEAMGQVGFSGRTQFPHLHLSVRHKGQVIDPFDPDGQITCGTADPETLWQMALPYTPGSLISTGFSSKIPAYDQIKDGRAGQTSLPGKTDALVLWAYAFGSRAGDVLRLQIDGPNGVFLTKEIQLDKPQAQFFRAAGKRRPPEGFAPGRYTGLIQLIRNGAIIDSQTTRTQLR